VTATVTSWSTIRVKRNTYSVSSSLIGETVRVRVYDERLEVYYGDAKQLEVERLLGEGGHVINYRHIIWSLVRKPGAFARYKYREALFPSLSFRRAYDALLSARPEREADIEYLRILHLAASTMEAEVQAALELLHEANTLPSACAVRAMVAPEQPDVPALEVAEVDLRDYDSLLELRQEVGA
jgi:hypothetical protein